MRRRHPCVRHRRRCHTLPPSDRCCADAYTISRNCSTLPAAGPYCLEVNTTALPADHGILVAERAYLQRSTEVGPLDSSLLMPHILHFSVPSMHH